MTNVWILQENWSEGEPSWICGVYATKELAEAEKSRREGLVSKGLYEFQHHDPVFEVNRFALIDSEQ